MGLVDFWCYENEEFEFKDGHMLLRGSNGSGKSVTLQSFIPLLLDGNKSSERLDTFGTRSRRMDTYLIDEHSDRQERIGYLYLEFKRKDLEIYKTIGMGLRARKNKPLQSWYFVIEDNRRINVDIHLIENQYTLSQKQLKNLLGNQVIDTQSEYMNKVNQSLFGFDNIDDYKDAINLLLQLRSPKLSNSLSPEKISEILSQSLQPLSEEEIRPMSEAIMNMDTLYDDLEHLKQSLHAAKIVEQQYDLYNKSLLIDKWNKYVREEQEVKKIADTLRQKKEEHKNNDKTLEELLFKIKNNRISKKIKTNEKMSLIDSNIDKSYEKYQQSKLKLTEKEKEYERKNENLENKKDKSIDIKNKIERYQENIFLNEKNIKKYIQNLDELYENFPFADHNTLKQKISNNEKISFQYSFNLLKEELKLVEEGIVYWNELDKYNQLLSYYNDDYSKYLSSLEQCEHNLETAKNNYVEILEEYNEYFYSFNHSHQQLQLSKEDIQSIIELLIHYEQNKNYLAINNIINEKYNQLNENYSHQFINLKYQLNTYQKDIDSLTLEYNKWLNSKDIEPFRDEIQIENRNYLRDKMIPSIPLYQLLEFNDGLSQEDKNRIEDLLIQNRLLDSLVVSKKYKEEILKNEMNDHDYYLWTDKDIDDLEIVYLDNTYSNLISHICNKLYINERNHIETYKHYYQDSLINGTITDKISSVYIGYNNRLEKRNSILNELKTKINSLENKCYSTKEEMNSIHLCKETLSQEYKSIKKEDNIKNAYEQIRIYELSCSDINKKILEMNAKIVSVKQTHNQILDNIKKISNKILVSNQKAAFENRKNIILEYQNVLNELKREFESYGNYLSFLKSEENNYDDLLYDIDQLHYEIDLIYSEVNILKGEIKNLKSLLDEVGYENIKERLSLIEDELSKLDEEFNNDNRQSITIEANQNTLLSVIDDLEELYNKNIKRKEIYKEIFEQELNHKFVFNSDINKKDYNHIFSKLANQLSNKKNTNEYLLNLQKSLSENNIFLVQYHPTLEKEMICHDVEEFSDRRVLKVVHQGIKIHFCELTNILNESIDIQNMLINDKDREIFEDILVNTVGKKIRNRIQASRRWIDKMDKYMREMNTSSGLQLTLSWRSIKSDNNQQLDISQLVELLEKDYHLLKDSDKQKITKHFRTKIQYARKMSTDENVSMSFHQLIRDALDYRKWFDFVIYAKKPNEKKKELTTRIFHAYSGGEKAIAMYVPLFSAVAAKFASCKEDAPLVIALDEAFAGVDEKNINSLFALIEKFEFDYIMNSQVLWGDYPACRSLAIYELFRPNNAPFVTVIPYEWNGFKKKVKLV